MDQSTTASASNPTAPNVQSRPQPPLADYKFTPEELRVLRECNTESFFQRCLPMGSLLGLSTYYGIRAGYLKASPKWGPTPKVMVAVTLGYFLGKFSYQGVCAEKFMKLPNSRLGELLRQRRRGGIQENIESGLGASMALAPFSSISSNDTYSDIPQNSLDVDSYRPLVDVTDSYRSSMDSSDQEFPENPPSVPVVKKSYEELRKQNREEYQKSRGVNYRAPAPADPNLTPSPVIDSPPVVETTPSFPTTGRRNKYGDIID